MGFSTSGSFNFNSNITLNGKKVFSARSNSDDGGQAKLTAQQEYWLNRILRDYAGKVYLLIIFLIVGILAVVYFATK